MNQPQFPEPGSARVVEPAGGTARPAGRAVMGRTVGIAAALTIASGLLLAPGAGADDLSQKKQQIDEQLAATQDEIGAFNKKVARASGDVRDAREQLQGARQNLAQALSDRETALAERSIARAELRRVKKAIERAERKLERVKREIAILQRGMGDFARRAYQVGPYRQWEMLLGSATPSDFARSLEAIRDVGQANNLAMDRMAKKRRQLNTLTRKLARDKIRSVELKKTADSQFAAAREAAAGAAAAKELVDSLIAREESALRIVRQNRADVKAQFEELAEEQRKIHARIKRAARKLAKRTGVKTSAYIGNGGGEWLFPLPGAVIGSNAGMRVDPILRFRRCHAGSDIASPMMTPILAVADGVVLSATSGGGYGNYLVISHGGQLTSTYAHQARLAVSAGESVRQGQVIGYVGSTGMSTGPHLHLEARLAGVPMDPRGWFGTGVKVPVC